MRRHIVSGFYNTLVHPPNNHKPLIPLKTLFHFSTTTSPNPTAQTPENPLIVDHLITTFGFSKGKAISTSKRFAHSTTPATLTSIAHFFKQNGFSDTHLKNLISKQPLLLCSEIDTTLKPNLKYFEQKLGLTGPSLADIVVANPDILFIDIDDGLRPNINLLQYLLLSNQQVVKLLKKNSMLLSKKIRPTFDYLRDQVGVPDKLIADFLVCYSRTFILELKRIKGFVNRVDELGVKRGSLCYLHAVGVVSSMTQSLLQARFESYKTYGLSESDILSAFRKHPHIIALTEGNLRKIMSFFIDELGYEAIDIIKKPWLLSSSLDKTLKPRNEVLKILTSRGLLKEKPDFFDIIELSKKRFLKNYVVKFMHKAPHLREVYKGASA